MNSSKANKSPTSSLFTISIIKSIDGSSLDLFIIKAIIGKYICYKIHVREINQNFFHFTINKSPRIIYYVMKYLKTYGMDDKYFVFPLYINIDLPYTMWIKCLV